MAYIIHFRTRAGSEYKTRRDSHKDALAFCVQVRREGGTFVAIPAETGRPPITQADVDAHLEADGPGEPG